VIFDGSCEKIIANSYILIARSICIDTTLSYILRDMKKKRNLEIIS